MMPKDDNGKIIKGDADYVDTYKAMEKALKAGKTKAIGVSNFSKAELERLLKETSVVSDISLQFCYSLLTSLGTRGASNRASPLAPARLLR